MHSNLSSEKSAETGRVTTQSMKTGARSSGMNISEDRLPQLSISSVKRCSSRLQAKMNILSSPHQRTLPLKSLPDSGSVRMHESSLLEFVNPHPCSQHGNSQVMLNLASLLDTLPAGHRVQARMGCLVCLQTRLMVVLKTEPRQGAQSHLGAQGMRTSHTPHHR